VKIAKKWLIVGASGLLGGRLASYLQARNHEVVALYWQHPLLGNLARFGLQVNLLDGKDACQRAISDIAPDVVINCAGLTNVDQCEDDPDQAVLLNSNLAGRLADASNRQGCFFVHISTDHLWDGRCRSVAEDMPLDPINVYAKTKAGGEVEVRKAHPQSLVLRTNFFGPSLPWRKSFSDWLTEELCAGRPINAFSDVFFTPIATDLLCARIVELVDKKVSGVLNLAGGERVSKYDFAMRWAERTGLDKSLIHAGLVKDRNLRAPRPGDMSLDCSKAEAILGRPMPSLDESFLALDESLLTYDSSHTNCETETK